MNDDGKLLSRQRAYGTNYPGVTVNGEVRRMRRREGSTKHSRAAV